MLPIALATLALTVPSVIAAPRVQQGRGGRAAVAPTPGADLAARDRRTGFDDASGQAARIDLQGLRPGDARRAIALVALGASGAIAERGTLIAAATEGPVDDRVAALLGLGELGSGIGEGLPLLERLALAESGPIQAASLVGLARCNEPQARASLARLAGADDALGALAREVMAHAIDPDVTRAPDVWRQLYEYRWEGARRFGTVDGKPWRIVQIEELARNRGFLESLVYACAPDLTHGAAHDQLLELLLTPGLSPSRIDAAVRVLPAEVERLIDSGVWRPATRFEWIRLVEAIVVGEDWRRFPGTLALAAVTPEVRPTVAALLHQPGGPYEDALLEAFQDEDPRARASAAYAVGAAGLVDYSTVLRDLSEETDPLVRANALAARLRLGEAAAQRELEALFATPRARRPARLDALLFEVFERAAPAPQVIEFLDRIGPTLDELDRLQAEAIIVSSGRRSDTQRLREVLPSLDASSPEAFRIIRALAKEPDARDLEALAEAFPFDGSNVANLFCATALVRGRHRAVDPLLAAAAWDLDYNLSILAAGIVCETRGTLLLRQWLVRPPTSVSNEDIRRLGYALGEWGGFRELEALRADLGTATGTEEPALQGAYYGMLAGRTR